MRSSCQQCPWFLPHGSKMSELERWITSWMHRQITDTNADPTTLSVRGSKCVGTFQFLDISRLIEETADEMFSFSSIKPENCDVGKPSPAVPISSSAGILRWLVPNFRILHMDIIELQMIYGIYYLSRIRTFYRAGYYSLRIQRPNTGEVFLSCLTSVPRTLHFRAIS